MKRKHHYILMLFTLIVALGSAVLIPRVNVNSDMTKYLPDHSKMKYGLEILNTEFEVGRLTNVSVRALFPDLQESQRDSIANELAKIEHVQQVEYKVSEQGNYTRYDLVVPQSVDQKTLGQSIRSAYGEDIVVETSQDGATPPFSVIVIAAALIIAILLIMSQSWLDPFVILFSTGMAVAINIGTNALLPSVSITTNYIVAILQLVLSLDYSIVLINRFRQEYASSNDTLSAVNGAIRLSYSAILSSALTTVVGLLMLAFMRLKIGLDMGIVLAKGVVCSLLCTFSLLPSLLLLFSKAMQRTQKRTFLVPTGRLGWFATHHKISLAIIFLVLFCVSFYFSRFTKIYFSTNGESQIEKVFPESNDIVLIYDTQDEPQILPLADSLMQLDGVERVISYPTLLKRSYSAPKLVEYIQHLTSDLGDFMPKDAASMDMNMLSPEMMQLVYYFHSNQADTLTVRFGDLMNFIRNDCMTNPMFDTLIDDNVRSQIALLEQILEANDAELEPESTPVKSVQKAEPVHTTAVQDKPKTLASHQEQPKAETVSVPSKVLTSSVPSDKMPVIDFMRKFDAMYNNEETHYLLSLTDTTRLREDMTVRQMSDYIGSTMAQTKMVFSFSKEGKRMTPLQYVHFLVGDLFQRKALANMVSADQKLGLQTRTRLMDYANANASISYAQMATLLSDYGFDNMTAEQVKQIYAPVSDIVVAPVSVAHDSIELQSLPVREVAIPQSAVAAQPVLTSKPRVHVKTKEERQAELFSSLLSSDKRFTAAQMARNFSRLGQNISPDMVQLLYCYYGTKMQYDSTLCMTPEQLLTYVSDTLVNNPSISPFLGENAKQTITDAKCQLLDGIKMLAHDRHSMMLISSSLPKESDSTYAYVDNLTKLSKNFLPRPSYLVGESAMFSEMKNGFAQEMTTVTILTILAIFIIVAITFRSLVVPTILVMTVLTAVYVNVVFSGIVSGQMLYLAYLIVQSILMGATIDYGIVFANYYKEYRKTMSQYDAAAQSYRGSIRTIMTSGLIMVLGPGAMALLVDDVAISAIVGCISIGAFVAILLILLVLPGVLVAFDKWVVKSSAIGNKK